MKYTQGNIFGSYRNNGKENGKYYIIIGCMFWGYTREGCRSGKCRQTVCRDLGRLGAHVYEMSGPTLESRGCLIGLNEVMRLERRFGTMALFGAFKPLSGLICRV